MVNGAKVSSPPDGSPVAVLVPSLQARALAFHRDTYGPGCDCHDAGTYPCADCAQEIADLVELLDRLAKDAIRVTFEAWERLR